MNREQRRQRKRKEREERIRQQRARERIRRASEDEPRTPVQDADVENVVASVGVRPFQMERTLLDLHRAMEGQEFASAEEMNAYAQTLLGPGLKMKLSGRPPTPKERAQELAFDALESTDAAEALRLANLALEFDPDNVDALATRASLLKPTLPEFVARLEEAVAVGQRVLGAPFFAENRGRFWGLVETRPYMRTRYSLARLLWTARREDDAIEHFEAMLDLNPQDSQGVRYELVACYLATGDTAGAAVLLDDQFRDDASGTFAWARVLLHLLDGEPRQAEKDLRMARKRNPHAEKYLTGMSRVPQFQGSTYMAGNESEAIVVAGVLGDAWKRHPEAMAWLHARGKRGQATDDAGRSQPA